MCESNAYIKRGDKPEEILLEDVARVTFGGEFVVLTGVLGNQISVKAEVLELDLMGHRLLLRERD
ncbi:MAG: CooT family nickel-binding protein [Deltaproteobacteria bacterium]|nr:CooT family nickel-binding protein [Deltaproteobacteria bacterium]